MNLRGKNIWLTGASLGIGEALAHELAHRGANLALTARGAEKLEELAGKLASTGVKVLVLPGDVTSLEDMKSAAGRAVEFFGPIDLLLSNAGTHIESHPENFNCDDYLKLMNINYGGLLRCMQAVVPAMVARKAGTIVGVCSVAGYRGLPLAAGYGASKSAMIHFLESARFHLRREGLKVVIVNPGFVKTPLTDKNKFTMPFIVSAPFAARRICDRLEADADKITFPRPFNWFMETMRVMPASIYNFVAEAAWRRT